MSRTRIISLAVIVLSVVAIVWSLGGGMFRERGFDFTIEGAMTAGEVPDTTGWGVADLELHGYRLHPRSLAGSFPSSVRERQARGCSRATSSELPPRALCRRGSFSPSLPYA